MLDRLGFGHEALHAMNPGIVSCSLSGWGLAGPYRLRGGHDINYMALMGGLERSGVPERPIVSFPPPPISPPACRPRSASWAG